MSGSKLKVELDVKNIDLFKNLVELLEKHFDDLPVEIQDSLKTISKDGINDFTADDFFDMFPDRDSSKIETSFRTSKIMSINKILRKVVFYEDDKIKTEYPDSFYLKYDGISILEW